MDKILRYAGQALVYALFAALVGYFSAAPSYQHFPPDKALIKLTFAHAAKPKGACREPSEEELAALSRKLRRKKICPRQRLPVYVELEIDGKALYRKSLPPTGLHGDGPAHVYEGFPVAAGEHRIVARLRDSDRAEGFDYNKEEVVELSPGQHFIVDFHADAGGFLMK